MSVPESTGMVTTTTTTTTRRDSTTAAEETTEIPIVTKEGYVTEMSFPVDFEQDRFGSSGHGQLRGGEVSQPTNTAYDVNNFGPDDGGIIRTSMLTNGQGFHFFNNFK